MTRRTTAFLLLLLCASFAAAQARPVGVRVSENVMEAMVTKKVSPTYPPDARKAGIEGTVVLQVIISKNGDVENIQLISGHPTLAEAAIDAVKQWKYKPYLLNGVSVSVETKVQVNFVLSNKPENSETGAGKPSGAANEGTPYATPPRKIRVSESVESGLLEKKVQPIYPQEAKDAHVQGTVLMKVVIDTDGNVANLEVISGHPMLVPPSLEAVRQWKYKPYRLNDVPVEVETQVQVNYTLAN